MDESITEIFNKKLYNAEKKKNFHELADCFDDQLTDTEIIERTGLSGNEIQYWRDKYQIY